MGEGLCGGENDAFVGIEVEIQRCGARRVEVEVEAQSIGQGANLPLVVCDEIVMGDSSGSGAGRTARSGHCHYGCLGFVRSGHGC